MKKKNCPEKFSKQIMKTSARIYACFIIALLLSVVIAKIAGVNFGEETPTVIHAFDVPVIIAPIDPSSTSSVDSFSTLQDVVFEFDEFEENEYESDENAYKRTVYIPEHVIVIEYEETEEEYIALLEDVKDVDYFTPFTTYVYCGERKTLPASEKLQEIVYKYSEKYDLPFRIVLALLGVETTWNENPDHVEVHSGVKYIGIGCINEKYHSRNLANKDINIYTLEGNVEGICWLLRAQYDRFGTMNYAIMAYNGGAGYTQNQINKGVIENSYTKRIQSYAESFK